MHLASPLSTVAGRESLKEADVGLISWVEYRYESPSLRKLHWVLNMSILEKFVPNDALVKWNMYILMPEEIPARGATLPFPRIESWRVYRYVSNFFLLLLPLGPFVLSFFSPATSQSAFILARLSYNLLLLGFASVCIVGASSSFCLFTKNLRCARHTYSP